MQTYLTLTRRELGSFFVSWIAYIVIAGAVFLMGLSFVSIVEKLQGAPTAMPVTEIFLSLCFWMILLFSSPIITMRLFSLEKYSGTFETLMTTPVSDIQVVLAKFTAAMILYAVMWLPLLGCIGVLRYVGQEPGLLDPGTLGATFLGILLLGALYISLGCFASSLTRSQIVAAMTSFALGLALFLVGFLANTDAGQDDWKSALLNTVSIRDQMGQFGQGIVDTRPIVFQLSLCALFLFLTYRVVESRRWR